MARSPAPLAALIAAALAFACSGAAAADDADIVVGIRKDGPAIHVKVDCPVRAPPAIAWQVLTDYDRMARFVSNLTESTVRLQMGNRLQVQQKGTASRGPLAYAFRNLREVELVPQTEIRSKIVEGDTIPASFVTRIEERGGVTHVVHTGSYTPPTWVPPVLGPMLIEAETRKQYGELRAEMLRRAKGP